MNKNQKKVLWGTGILILLVLMSIPEIFWKKPTTPEGELRIIQTRARIDRGFFIYYPSVILAIGGSLFYLFRDKKDK